MKILFLLQLLLLISDRVGVYLTGVLLSTPTSWDLVWQIAGSTYIVGVVFFLLFAEGQKLIE